MISIINNPNSTVAYFKQEEYNQLIVSGVKKKDLEKAGIQSLLQYLGYGELEILRKETGQPYFKDRPELFLSISHAKGWFAISVSSEPVGIDIQTHSSRLIEGQDYFRNSNELAFSTDETALHLIWGAKEAFYKLMEGQIPDLKEEVSVLKISDSVLTIIFESRSYQLGYRLIDDAFVVFTF